LSSRTQQQQHKKQQNQIKNSNKTTTKHKINNNNKDNNKKTTKHPSLFKSYFVSLCEQLDGVARAVEPVPQEGPPDAEMVQANVGP
jgi:hypothetical protein